MSDLPPTYEEAMNVCSECDLDELDRYDLDAILSDWSESENETTGDAESQQSVTLTGSQFSNLMVDNYYRVAASSLKSHLYEEMCKKFFWWPLAVIIEGHRDRIPTIRVETADPRRWPIEFDDRVVPADIGERVHSFLFEQSVKWDFRVQYNNASPYYCQLDLPHEMMARLRLED